MDWFLCDNGPRHERVNRFITFKGNLVAHFSAHANIQTYTYTYIHRHTSIYKQNTPAFSKRKGKMESNHVICAARHADTDILNLA